MIKAHIALVSMRFLSYTKCINTSRFCIHQLWKECDMMPLTLTPRKHSPDEIPQRLFLQENKQPYISHDLLFKELIQNFFESFIEVFFPNIYTAIDFESIKFITEEAIPNAFKAEQNLLDIVVEATCKTIDSPIILHVEAQSYQQKNFNERMYYYHCLLYAKHRKPIIPIVVLSYDAPGYSDYFELSFADERLLQFNYYPIHLKSLHWKDFAHIHNPVSAALMSKMTYKEDKKLQLKESFFRILHTLELNNKDLEFLYRFSDVYLPLSKEEVRKLMAKLKGNQETFDISKLPDSFVEYGKSIGREENKVQVVLKMLEKDMSIDLIVELTDLPKEKVLELKNNM